MAHVVQEVVVPSLVCVQGVADRMEPLCAVAVRAGGGVAVVGWCTLALPIVVEVW